MIFSPRSTLPLTEEIDSATVAILASGLGSRLKPTVPDRPKVLAPIRGRPFLAYQFDDLAAFWDWHRDRGAAASILLNPVADAARYGRVRTDDDGRVLAFEEKPQAGPGWASAGVYTMTLRAVA